jgi:hypothetical protein
MVRRGHTIEEIVSDVVIFPLAVSGDLTGYTH